MFFQQLLNGITMGSTYALIAIGYSMVFGILELVNFSHGSIYMFGAMLTLVLITSLKMNFISAFILSIILTGVVGILVDKITLLPLRNKKAPKISALISTIGFSIFLQNLIMILFGSETKNFPNIIENKSIKVLSLNISYIQLLIFFLCIVLLILLALMIYKTKLGEAMRAASQNTVAAKLMGINVDYIITSTFFIGSSLAAVAGTLVGMYYQTVDPFIGFMAGLKAFAAAVLGGIGSLSGAVIGGITIGIIETLAAGYINSGYRDAIAFGVLIIVLIFKPSGILGKESIKKV